MKSTKFFLLSIVLLVIVLGFSVQTHAALNLIGQGTSTHGTYNLIYDTDLDLTWYDYTSDYTTWQNQLNWADALSVNFGGSVFDDWRLPMSDNCSGYNCTGSEMGHLYYTGLGNTAGGPLSNKGDFQNLYATTYFSGSTYYLEPVGQVPKVFHLATGNQQWYNMSSNLYALAVRDGLGIVPEPVSSTLFIVGGATLGFRRFRKKIKSI